MSEKLTDERLQRIESHPGDPNRAEIMHMATELLALRAERAKATQSDEERACALLQYVCACAAEVPVDASSVIAESKPIASAFASIRAEGSDERAKLEDARVQEQLTRELAVMIVDGSRGYTMEFAQSPAQHRQAYDDAQENLTIALRTNHMALAAVARPAESGATELRKVAADFLGACPTCGAIDEPQCSTVGCSDEGAKT